MVEYLLCYQNRLCVARYVFLSNGNYRTVFLTKKKNVEFINIQVSNNITHKSSVKIMFAAIEGRKK